MVLSMYVLARDGYSGKIVAASVMPRKNNLLSYDEVYRHCLVHFGLWDQIRVDTMVKNFILPFTFTSSYSKLHVEILESLRTFKRHQLVTILLRGYGWS